MRPPPFPLRRNAITAKISRYQAGLSKLCLGASRDRARAVISNADYAGSDANVALAYSQPTNATFMYIGGARIKGPRRCVPPGLLGVYSYYPSTNKFVKGDLRSLPERVVDSSYVVSLTVPSALQVAPQVTLDVSNIPISRSLPSGRPIWNGFFIP
ncbi:unnamed protein product [Closterium sp. NIES-64]|nr:unnamed protein product [Closterium sp. NIES-64]